MYLNRNLNTVFYAVIAVSYGKEYLEVLTKISLLVCYVPNKDDPTFFSSSFERLLDFKCDEVIIGGGYNLVLDVERDKCLDVWRIQNPEQGRFTWRQKNPEVQCRLDFFLVSECTSCNSINTDIAPG